MSLFKRRSGAADDEPVEDVGPDEAGTDELDADGAADDAHDDATAAVGERRAALQALADLRRNGPFDSTEVDDTSAMLDLGSILVAPTDGMELRLELSDDQGQVVGVTAIVGDSAVQVQAFAAPRSEGIWDEVREEIAAGLTQQGGTADEADGVFGRELLARVPAQDEQGRSAFQPARFVGVDGPRWFLRAVFTGAAVEPARAGAVEDLVRGLVVVRGTDAMAPRELLPLKLPEMPGDAVEGADGEDGEQLRSADDLNPFERGPEITEIR